MQKILVPTGHYHGLYLFGSLREFTLKIELCKKEQGRRKTKMKAKGI
jgi:hypothetical protein